VVCSSIGCVVSSEDPIKKLAEDPDLLDAVMEQSGPKNPSEYKLSAPGGALMEAAMLSSAVRGGWGSRKTPGNVKRKKAKAARKKAKRHKKRRR